jgi:hypothetical protein
MTCRADDWDGERASRHPAYPVRARAITGTIGMTISNPVVRWTRAADRL